jgi:lipid A 3-O-deacylase
MRTMMCILCFLSLVSSLRAGQVWPDMHPHQNPPLLSVGAGVFNTSKEHKVADFQLECTSTYTKFLFARWLGGVMMTSEGGSFLYSGIGWDILIGKSRLVVIPGFAPGIYLDGGGKKLGFPVEFRSSIGLAYQFPSQNRMGVQYYHLSNASMGNRNPGVEVLMCYFAVPFHFGMSDLKL